MKNLEISFVRRILFSRAILFVFDFTCPFGGEAFIVPRVEIEVWVG